MSAKFGLNMLFPFSSPLEVKQVMRGLLLLLIALVVLLTSAAGALFLLRPRQLLLAAGWWIITVMPTAVLGSYADRYLGLPFVGVAILIGLIGHESLLRMKRRMPLRPVIVTLVALYAMLSVHRLTFYRRLWQEAAREIQTTMAEAHRLAPNVPPGSVLYFVNLTHNKADGQVFVFNTGFNGILLASGYDKSIVGHRICKLPDPREQRLVAELSHCPAETSGGGNHVIFLAKERLVNLSGNCAEKVVSASCQRDSDLWR